MTVEPVVTRELLEPRGLATVTVVMGVWYTTVTPPETDVTDEKTVEAMELGDSLVLEDTNVEDDDVAEEDARREL